MPNYKYVAKDKNGKNVTGTMQFDKESQLVESLWRKNLVIVSIKEVKAVRTEARLSKKKIKLDDLVIFSRQLATMIDSGIPLMQTLDILGEQIEKQQFREIIRQIGEDVQTGSSFSEAIARHPQVFSKLFVNMVKAGESSGTLDDILDRLAAYLEKTENLRKKVRSSLVYPAVVTSMALLITMVLILKVIPTFKGIFSSLGGTLPLPTRMLILLSDTLRHYLLLVVLFGGLAVFAVQKYIRTENGRLRFDKTLLQLPVFGPLFRKISVARFTRTFSTLIKSGVPILDSLDIVSKTSGNRVLEAAVDRVRGGVREGEPIAAPLGLSGVFPPMVVRMISVGEESGQLEAMLSKIADFYDQEVDNVVSGLTSMIEPLIIAFLGIIIGSIVIAMFLPIFKLTQLITSGG